MAKKARLTPIPGRQVQARKASTRWGSAKKVGGLHLGRRRMSVHLFPDVDPLCYYWEDKGCDEGDHVDETHEQVDICMISSLWSYYCGRGMGSTISDYADRASGRDYVTYLRSNCF